MLLLVSRSGDRGGRDEAAIALEETATSDPSHGPTIASRAPLSHEPTLPARRASPAGSALADGVSRLPEVGRGRYEIGAEVGRGGLGRVSRARDLHLDRTVAIKELHAGGEDARRRFVREALVTARLEHPGIVAVHEAGRWPDGDPFYAMKLVRGRPLAQLIDACKTLDDRLALIPTVLAVADAVAYAHSESVVHRDLKPHNVLVGDFGETVVIDWGLAKDLRATDSIDTIDDATDVDRPPRTTAAPTTPGQTIAGSVMGTPGYMPPEQAAGEVVDARADVYALGAMLYHVLTGVPPHLGKDIDLVLAAILRGDLVPLIEREPSVPRDLATIVTKAMARDREARYPSARELAEDLRRFQTGQLVGAHHYTRTQRVTRWLRRRRALAITAAIAIAIGCVGLWRIVTERGHAVVERDRAIAAANRASVAQARAALARDPAESIAWLRAMSPAGGGWDQARLIAADALARQPAQHILVGHRGWPRGLAVDGDRAVTWDDVDVWVWDLTAGAGQTFALDQVEQVRPCTDRSWIDGHRIGPGGKRIDFAINVRTGARWDESSETPSPAGTCAPATAAVSDDDDGGSIRMMRKMESRRRRSVVVDPQRRYLLDRVDDEIVLRDVATSAVRHRLTVPGVEQMMFSPDGRWFAAVGEAAVMLDLDVGIAITLEGQRVVDAVFLADGRLATVGEDRALRIWAPVARARPLYVTATAAVLEPASGGFLVGTQNGGLHRVAADGAVAEIARPGGTGAIDSIAIGADGGQAVAIGREVWSIASGGAARRLGEHPDADPTRRVSRGVDRVALAWLGRTDLASWDGESLLIWAGGGSHPVTLPAAPPEPPSDHAHANFAQTAFEVCSTADRPALSVAPGGRWIAVSRLDHGMCDGAVILVDVAARTGRLLEGARGQLAGFSRDGALLATGATKGEARIWDLAAGTARALSASVLHPYAATFSPDDRRVAITGEGGVSVVELSGGRPRELATTGAVRDARFSADGLSLVTTSADGLMIWDVALGAGRAIGAADPLAYAIDPAGVRAITSLAAWTIPDDLPRLPSELAGRLDRLPYALRPDGSGAMTSR
jgi:hypothetical protein